jgi:archaellin
MARRDGARARRTILWLLLLLVFVGYLLWALRAEETLRVVRKQLEQTSSGVVVSGQVYNATAAVAIVNVEVSFFDTRGRELSQETVVLHNVDAGATAEFRTQPKMLTEVKDYTIYVNTGRNMYGN